MHKTVTYAIHFLFYIGQILMRLFFTLTYKQTKAPRSGRFKGVKGGGAGGRIGGKSKSPLLPPAKIYKSSFNDAYYLHKSNCFTMAILILFFGKGAAAARTKNPRL